MDAGTGDGDPAMLFHPGGVGGPASDDAPTPGLAYLDAAAGVFGDVHGAYDAPPAPPDAFLGLDAPAAPLPVKSEPAATPDDDGDGDGNGDDEIDVQTVPSAAGQAPQTVQTGADAAPGRSKPRKKLWLCVYPGCHEPPKTHYNCHSHVWDAHIRHQLPPENPLAALVYKRLPDRGAVKALCRGYVVDLSSTGAAAAAAAGGGAAAVPRRRGKTGAATVSRHPGPVLAPGGPDSTVVSETSSSAAAAPSEDPSAASSSTPSPLSVAQHPVAAAAAAAMVPSDEDEGAHFHIDAKKARSGVPDAAAASDAFLGPNSAAVPISVPLDYHQQQQQMLQQQRMSSVVAASTASSSSAMASPAQTTPSPPSYGQVVPSGPVAAAAAATGTPCEYPSYSLDPNDIVRIVSMSPELARLHVCGEVFSERGFLQRSDARFKEDIAPIRGALARVLRITGKTFRYRGDDAVKMGFIAQELETVVPTAVHRDEHGLSVDVVSLVPLILEALKDLYAATQEYESGTAKQLNDALHDALVHVADLDRKFEQFRHPEPSDTDDGDGTPARPTRRTAHTHTHGGVSSDNSASDGYLSGACSDDSNVSNSDDCDSSTSIAMHRRSHSRSRSRSRSHSRSRADVSRDKDKSKCKCKNSSNGSDSGSDSTAKNKFTYQPVFGPPLIVMICSVFFLGVGFATWIFLPSLPFVWAYSWLVGGALLLSLLYQWRDVRDMFRHKEVVLTWNVSMSINVFVLAVIALIGTILTLILGPMAIALVCFILVLFLVLWVFAVIIHQKYHVRVQSLFVVFVGVLVIGSLFFAMLFMARPYECGFDGHTGPLITVPVRVGQEIAPISMNPIPWNCFFPAIRTSAPLPTNITVESNYSPPYIHGRITKLFDAQPSTVVLSCSSYQQFTCGTLLFLACSDYTTELACRSNYCSWCNASSGTAENSTGVCGFCTDAFESACFSTTGRHSTCFANATTAAAAPLRRKADGTLSSLASSPAPSLSVGLVPLLAPLLLPVVLVGLTGGLNKLLVPSPPSPLSPPPHLPVY